MAQVYLNQPGALQLTVAQKTDDSGNITFKDSTGAAIDLTGYTFSLIIASTPGFTGFTIAPTFVGNPNLGVINIVVTRAQVPVACPGTTCELWSKDGSGNYRLWAQGQFIVISDLAPTL